MKKLMAVLSMLIAPFLPGAAVTNKKKDELPTEGHTDSTEMHEAHNIFDEALEMAAAARRVEEEIAYKSCGLERPNSENRYVITMNADGTFEQRIEKDPNGIPFKPVTEKDRKAYKTLQKFQESNPVEMDRPKATTYKLVNGKFVKEE